MHVSQALPLLPLFFAPFTLAAPAPDALAAPEPNPPPPPPPSTCYLGKAPYGCVYPDQYQTSFLGFTGDFKGHGFPYFLDSTQGRVCPGRLDDTVRRALQIPRVGNNYFDYLSKRLRPEADPRDLQHCQYALTPIFQGTSYIGNQQIYVTWDADRYPDPTNQDVVYCGYSAPKYDSKEQFFDGCTIPIPVDKPGNPPPRA